MKNLKSLILFDSTCGYEESNVKFDIDVQVYDLKIVIEDKEYIDNKKNISFDEIYKIQQSSVIKTSQGSAHELEMKIKDF